MHSRLFYLDGLRGVLAIIVFVHHYFYAFCPDLIFGGPEDTFRETSGLSFCKLVAFTPINLFFNPGMAIHFFFLLSGYVQSYAYFQNPDLRLIQKSFIKRYFRLAVPTLAVILIVFAFHRLGFFNAALIPVKAVTTDWAKQALPDQFNLFEAIRHGLFSCFLSNSRYYPILWTMPIELQNSFMVFVLLFITHQIKRKFLFLIVWLLVQLFVLESFYAAAFTFGMLLCGLEKNSDGFTKFFSRPFIKALCLFIGLYFSSYPYVGYEGSTKNGFYGPISFFEKCPHVISYLFGTLLLFCFLLHSDKSKTLLSKNIFRFFGRISFMFYLSHFLLLFSVTPFLYKNLLPHLSVTVTLLITGIISFGLVTLASLIMYWIVDRPAVKFSAVYTKKLFGV